MQPRHTHYFIHQRAATDNGIIHLSYVKASAALDFFDNSYPSWVSEQHPLLYNTVVLSEPVSAVPPQIIHIFSATLTRRRRPCLCWEKYILNVDVKFEILSIGGNTVMRNMGSGCVTYPHVPRQVLHYHGTLLHILLHSFPCYLTPLPKHVQVKNNLVHTLSSEHKYRSP